MYHPNDHHNLTTYPISDCRIDSSSRCRGTRWRGPHRRRTRYDTCIHRHANELPNFRRPSLLCRPMEGRERGRANTLLRQLIPLSPLAVHNLLQRQGRDASLPLRPREPVQTLLRQEHSGTQLTARFRRRRVSEISLTESIQNPEIANLMDPLRRRWPSGTCPCGASCATPRSCG